MRKAAEYLLEDPAEQERFLEALMKGVGREQAILVLRDHPALKVFPRLGSTSWQPDFVLRLDSEFRAAKHPLYEKGHFYSLDFSSVFSSSALTAIQQPVRRILDLCSAPGGKAIFAWRLLNPEVLICNETIRKRCGMLIDNLGRCQVECARVWSSDPSVYAHRWPEAFDLVLVDAPCSGQSMLAKGERVPGAFHPELIDMNVGRQRRITAHAARCLRPGGHLFYSTCTFSAKENEKIIAWLCEQIPELEPVPVPALSEFQSTKADFPCYRLFPHQGLGAGAFVCLLRKRGDPPDHWPPIDDLKGLWWYGKPPREKPAALASEDEPKPESSEKPSAKPKPRPRSKPAPQRQGKAPRGGSGRRRK